MSRLAYLRSHRGLVAQWFGALAPAAAWSGQFLLTYNLADAASCSPGAPAVLTGNARVKLLLIVATVLAAALAAAGGLVAFACWRRLRAEDPTTGGRAHWLALAGVLSGVLFLLMIVASFLPLGFLTACARQP